MKFLPENHNDEASQDWFDAALESIARTDFYVLICDEVKTHESTNVKYTSIPVTINSWLTDGLFVCNRQEK